MASRCIEHTDTLVGYVTSIIGVGHMTHSDEIVPMFHYIGCGLESHFDDLGS